MSVNNNNNVSIIVNDDNYNDFSNFVKNINDSTVENDDYFDAIKNLYNGYTNFLVSRKYCKEYIKEMREKAVIDNYMLYINKQFDSEYIKNLSEYYKKNINDDFDKKLNPPSCIFTAASREKRFDEENKIKEYINCDINTHYKTINSKYEYYNNLNKLNELEDFEEFEAEIYEDEYCDEPYYYSTEEDEYYNDYISDYESDYLSDDYY